MKKVIYIPSEINTKNAVNFSWNLKSNYLDSIEKADYIFDFSKVVRTYPFGSLFLAKSIRSAIKVIEKKYNDINVYVDFNDGNKAASYLQHVGFFKYIGAKLGREPGEAKGSSTYIPITIHTIDELTDNATKKNNQIAEVIENESERVASIIISAYNKLDEDKANFAKQSISYSLREIMRNSIEHSRDNKVVIFAQSFPRLKRVEIAIMDDGIGIKSTLSEKFGEISPLEALRLALMPGVSRADTSIDTGDKWQNSGFGLYVVSELCKKLPKSQFFMVSSGASYSAHCDQNGMSEENTRSSYIWSTGTTTMLSISINGYSYFSNLLEQIVAHGERIAGANSLKGKASKGSKSIPGNPDM